jgi:hypothetical protein
MSLPKYFRILLFSTTAASLIWLQGCKCHGNCCDYVPVYYLNTGLYPYLFKTGTFWVYKNQTTGAIDSEYVYNYVHDTATSGFQGGPGYCGNVAQEEWNYWSLSFLNGVLVDTTLSGITASQPDISKEIALLTSNTHFQNGQTIFVLEPVNSELAGLYYRGTVPTLVVNGYTYNQVQQFYLNISQSVPIADSSNSMLYYVANVGLIRKTVYTNATDSVNWDLINKNIVQ